MSHTNRGSVRRNFAGDGVVKLGLFKRAKCAICDLSATGARLIVPETLDLPDNFRLEIRQIKRTLPCAVRWRDSGQAGVEFV